MFNFLKRAEFTYKGQKGNQNLYKYEIGLIRYKINQELGKE